MQSSGSMPLEAVSTRLECLILEPHVADTDLCKCLFSFDYVIAVAFVKEKNAAELINSSAFVDKHLKIFIFYRAVDKFEHEEDQSKTPKGDKYYAGLVTYFARLFSPTKSES